MPLALRTQIAFLFQAVQQRIKSSGADRVAVAAELLRHGEAKNGTFFDGMMEDVQANQA